MTSKGRFPMATNPLHMPAHGFAETKNPSLRMTAPTNAQDGTQYFLWFSDIHYDPYYSTPQAFRESYDDAACNDPSIPSIGKHGCDSSRTLVRATLEEAVRVVGGVPFAPTFVIVSGDSIRHGMDMFCGKDVEGSNEIRCAEGMEAAGKILRELSSMVEGSFPDAEVIFSVGNNDVVPDYYLELEGENDSSLTVETAGMLGVLFQALTATSDTQHNGTSSRTLLTPGDQSTFLRGGYYSRSLHDGHLVILSLNTVLYSGSFQPEPMHVDDPAGQFRWMKQVLKESQQKGAQVIIVGHIPPTVGSFQHNQLWKDSYIKTYFDVVHEFDGVIVGQLFGHLHSDEFRVGMENSPGTSNGASPSTIPSMGTPILLGPSVTPLHGHDPAFRLIKYGRIAGNETGDGINGKYKILDYESHRCVIDTGNVWSKLYTFSEAYSVASHSIVQEGLSSSTFHAILQSMEDESDGKESHVLKIFRNFVKSGANGDADQTGANVDCDDDCRAAWLCTFQSATRLGYDKCLLERRKSPQNGRTSIGMAGASLFVIVLVFVGIVRWRKIRKRRHYESAPSVLGDGRHDLETDVVEVVTDAER